MTESGGTVELAVRTDMEGDSLLAVLRTTDGQFPQELESAVADAIRRYPNMAAEWWLGPVAAIRVVEQWIIDKAQSGRS